MKNEVLILFIWTLASLLITQSAIAQQTFCSIAHGKARGHYCSDSIDIVVNASGTIIQYDDDGDDVESETDSISFSVSHGCEIVMEVDADNDAVFCSFSLIDD